MAEATIEFKCEHCESSILAKAEYAGKFGKCPHCKEHVQVPKSSETISDKQRDQQQVNK